MATSWYEQNCPPDSTFGGEGSTVLDTLTVLAVGAGIGAVAMHYLHATNRMGPTTIRDLKHRILGQYNQDRDTIPSPPPPYEPRGGWKGDKEWDAQTKDQFQHTKIYQKGGPGWAYLKDE